MQLLWLLALAILLHNGDAAQTQDLQRASLLSKLLQSYDVNVRPYPVDMGPTPVQVQYRLNLLFNIDSKQETWTADLYINEKWIDSRLKFNSTTDWPAGNGELRLNPASVWKPDTFFYNAVSCSAATDQIMSLDPNGSGSVVWARHQSCNFHSEFDLKSFPFDSQVLELQRISFGYPANELVIVQDQYSCFAPDPAEDFASSLCSSPLHFSSHSLFPPLSLSNFFPQILTGGYSSFSCASGVFQLQHQSAAVSMARATLNVYRLTNSYVIKMIAPMFLLVFLSSLTYWIDPMSAPARVGFSVTLVLSIVTFNFTVSQDLPKINYPTLLDGYVWHSFLFVIGAVGEFAVVNNILVRKTFPAALATATDDFCQWSIGLIWVFSNLLFWPPIAPSIAGKVFIVLAMITWITINVYRVWWNFRHEKKGWVIRHVAWAWVKQRVFNNQVPQLPSQIAAPLNVMQSYFVPLSQLEAQKSAASALSSSSAVAQPQVIVASSVDDDIIDVIDAASAPPPVR